MSNRGLITVWLLFLLSLFGAFYIATHIFVTRVMADFKVEETGYTTLEVKDNYGKTDNHYNVQPAKNVQEQ
jgi:hypothetical protein